MNRQDKLEEQEYIDLYNKGYGLYKFTPEMAELLVNTNSKSPQIEALKAGSDKAKSENEKDRLPDWLKNDRYKSYSKVVSKVKDIEPEKD